MHTHSRLQKMSFPPFPLLKQGTHGSNACTNVIYEDYHYYNHSFPMFVFLAQTGPAPTAVHGQNFGGFSGTVFLEEGGSPVSRQQPTVSKHSALPTHKNMGNPKKKLSPPKISLRSFSPPPFFMCGRYAFPFPPFPLKGEEREGETESVNPLPPLAWGVNAT